VSAGSLAHGKLGGPLSGGRTRGVGTLATPAIAAVGALTVLGAVLRFYGIGHQGFWYDEANTAMLVRLSPGKMLGLIPQGESTPPLYYCVAWVWARLFGDGEAGLRSLSAVAGVLFVPVAYGAGAKLISRRAGVIAAGLAACNPLLIWYSQEARSYALLVLLTGVSLLLFVYARARPSPRILGAWVVACALALATHYYASVAVIPQAAWLLAEHRAKRDVQIAVGIVAVCGLALIPLAMSQNGTGHDAWIAGSPFGERLRQIIPQFLIGTNAPERKLLKYLTMALGLVAVVLLALRSSAPERRGALVAGGLTIGGFVLSLLFVAVGFDDLITRNIIALWLPAALVVTAGLAARRARRIGVAVAVALCVIGVTATIGIAADRSLQRPDWRYVARALGLQPRDGTNRAILVQHYSYLLPLSLYMPRLHVMRRPERVSEFDVISVVSPGQPLCWWGAACNLVQSRMQRRYDIAGFHVVLRRHVLQWTVLTMASGRPVRLTPRTVAAALHTTSLPRDELIFQRG
jgi:mannosyltransferase